MLKCSPGGGFDDVENWVGVGELGADECLGEEGPDEGGDVFVPVHDCADLIDGVVSACVDLLDVLLEGEVSVQSDA